MGKLFLWICAALVAVCLVMAPAYLRIEQQTARALTIVPAPGGAAGAAAWGSITGTLSAQTDLGLALDARCLESVFGTSISTGLALDGTALKASTILQKYHGVDPSANALSLLGAANYAAMKALAGWYTTTTDLDADLQYLAGFTPTTDVKAILTAANNAAIKVLLGYYTATSDLDTDLQYLAGFTPTANVKSILTAADYAAIKALLGYYTATSDLHAALQSIAGLTEADVSVLEATADNTYAVVTSGGNNYFLGSNSDNTALEFKTPANVLSQIGAQVTDDDLTSLATPTAWRMFYSDAADPFIQEIALGANGTFLESNAVDGAPAFRALLAADIPDISSTYEVQLTNEAGLYAVLSDVSNFLQDNEKFTGQVTVQAFTADDATPDVSNAALGVNNFYQTANANPTTITDFDDGDGATHDEFADGDWFILRVDDENTTIDFSENLNIEGNAGVDFTGSATQIVYLLFIYEDARWNCVNFTSGYSTPTTLAISSIVSVETDFIPIAYMNDGAAPPATAALVTSTNTRMARAFDGASNENGRIVWKVPLDMDTTSGLKFQVNGVVGSATAPANEEIVAFSLAGASVGNSDLISAAAGNPQTSSLTADASYVQYDELNTDFSEAITTITNLAVGETVHFDLIRLAESTDTYEQDFHVYGITLKYKRNHNATF